MSLHLTPVTAASSLVHLDPKLWDAKLRAYARIREVRRTADAEARSAKAAEDSAKAEIMLALNGATAAVCGALVVTAKEGKPSAATLTLASGQTMPWSTVTSLLIGNVSVPGDQVAKLYGGRDGSLTLDVAGA